MSHTLRFFFALVLASALSVGAQEYAEEPTSPAETPPPADEQPIEFDLSPVDGEPEDELGTGEEQDFELIEGLLEEGSEVLEAPSAYDPGDRRDPFRSLLRNSENRDVVPTGPRPDGVPGLLIDEVTVTGIWVTPDGPVAQVQSTDTPMSYLLREGDQLYDGEVIRISLTRTEGAEVLFKQSVTDSTAPKPFRDVVRRLDN